MSNTSEAAHHFVQNLEPTHIGWIETTGAVADLLGLHLNSDHLKKPKERAVTITAKDKRFTGHILKIALNMLEKALQGYLIVKHNSLTDSPNATALTETQSQFHQVESWLDQLLEQETTDEAGIIVPIIEKPEFETATAELAELLLAFSFVTYTLSQLHHDRTVSYHSLMSGQKVDLSKFNELLQVTPHTAISFWNYSMFEGESGYHSINKLKRVVNGLARPETSVLPPYSLLPTWHFFTAMNLSNKSLAQQSQEFIVAEASKDEIKPATIQTNLDDLKHLYDNEKRLLGPDVL